MKTSKKNQAKSFFINTHKKQRPHPKTSGISHPKISMELMDSNQVQHETSTSGSLHFKSLKEKINEISFFNEKGDLILSNKKLQNFPDKMLAFKQIKHLYLQINFFRHLPKEIAGFRHLENLYLSNNQLEEIPEVVGAFSTKMKGLFLNNNKIKSLSEKIRLLSELTEIHLDNNCLTSFPEQVCALPNLKKLSLRSNDFSSIPYSEIRRLVKLQYLNLSGTPIQNPAKVLEKLKKALPKTCLIELDLENKASQTKRETKSFFSSVFNTKKNKSMPKTFVP